MRHSISPNTTPIQLHTPSKIATEKKKFQLSNAIVSAMNITTRRKMTLT